MSPTRPPECMRACVGDAAAPVLRPPCRSLPGRAGLGAPMVDTRTSRVSCRMGRRASCRQVGAGDTPRARDPPMSRGCGTWERLLVVGQGCRAGSALGCSTRSPWEALEPLNKVGVSARRIRPFFQICYQNRGVPITMASGHVRHPPSSPSQHGTKHSFSWGLSMGRGHQSAPRPPLQVSLMANTTGTPRGQQSSRVRQGGSSCPQLQISPFMPPSLSIQSGTDLALLVPSTLLCVPRVASEPTRSWRWSWKGELGRVGTHWCRGNVSP